MQTRKPYLSNNYRPVQQESRGKPEGGIKELFNESCNPDTIMLAYQYEV